MLLFALKLSCVRAAVISLFVFGSIAPALADNATPQDPQLVINVRTEVDRPFENWGKSELKEHGKVYAITSIEEEQSEWKLLKPVDENGLLQKLREELAKRGFQETTAQLKPEILITVNYGRGGLINPYLNTAPTKYLKSYDMDFAYKLQNANEEKLFIRITAWEFPQLIPGQQPKPRMLWKTIMLTDSPEDRDLNQFYGKLLAAGSGFFDKEIDSVETEVRDAMPEGTVTVGDIKVLKPGEADLPLSADKKAEAKK